MKLTVETRDLRAATNSLKAVLIRSQIPILEHVLLEAEGDRLAITGTDMDTTLRRSIPAQVESAGAAAVHGGRLAAIAGGAPEGGQIGFDLKEAALSIRSGRSRFRASVLPAEEFPQFKETALDCGFALEGKVLARCLALATPAVAADDSRPYLCGSFITRKDDGLAFVATNGHALHAVTIEMPEGLEALPAADGGSHEEGLILPAKACALLAKLFGEAASVEIACSPSLFRASDGEMVLASKLIVGGYPDYERIIPKVKGNLTVNRADFLAGLDRVVQFSERNDHGVCCRVADDLLTVAAVDTVSGYMAWDSLEAKAKEEICDIGLNARLISATLRVMDSEEVTLHVSAPDGAVRLFDPGYPDRVFIVMPLRANFPDLPDDG